MVCNCAGGWVNYLCGCFTFRNHYLLGDPARKAFLGLNLYRQTPLRTLLPARMCYAGCNELGATI